MEVLFEQTRELLHSLTETILYFRYNDYLRASKLVKQVLCMLREYIAVLEEYGLEEEVEKVFPVLQPLLDAVDQRNLEQVVELLQTDLEPMLFGLQKNVFGKSDNLLKDYWGKNRLALRKKDKALYYDLLCARDNIPDKYQLSWARTGDLVLTVQTAEGSVRLNSSGNPWQEAFLFSMGELKKDYEECVIFGFGMGYHVEMLIKESNVKKIVVLEYDLMQLAIALSYRDLSEMLSDSRLSVLYCPKPEMYVDWLKTKEGRLCSLWYPSIKTVFENTFRESLENYWIENSSVKNLGNILEENFKKNVENEDEEISVLKEVFYKKTMLLVAAGPSLEDNIEELRNLDRSECILVCVGKIARKLIQQEVYPDYIVMIDGQAGTVWQIRGIEDCMVPLIYLSTVAANVVNDYQGKRYIAFQEGFLAAEKYAAEKGYSLYQTGGSVATFALDMGIRMGCSCIICLGLDMGYLDERSHAFSIGASVADNKNLRKVEGIVSDYVYTSKTLDIYRQWIERRIRGEKKTQFINASKGARIYGMKEKSLKEYFSS